MRLSNNWQRHTDFLSAHVNFNARGANQIYLD
jgi:hypothetical protein